MVFWPGISFGGFSDCIKVFALGDGATMTITDVGLASTCFLECIPQCGIGEDIGNVNVQL